MDTDRTAQDTTRTPRVHTVGPVAVLLIGVMLVAYMITVEHEPGGLPLVLIAIGTGWLAAVRVRSRCAASARQAT